MSKEIINFFQLQRNIFGTCPKCDEIFRLSDIKIYYKQKPVADWLDQIENQIEKVEKSENKLNEIEQEIKEKARKEGR